MFIDKESFCSYRVRMRTIKDPDTRKNEILSGALKVFAEKGYDKTTITDIAKELGISQGLCYRYYESKEEIYDAALQKYAEFIVSKNLRHFEDDGSSLSEKIMKYSGSTDDFEKSEKDEELLYKLFHGKKSKKMHDELTLKICELMVPHFEELFEKAKEAGEIKIEDVKTFTYFFVYGQMGVLMNSKDEDSAFRVKNFLLGVLGLSQ